MKGICIPFDNLSGEGRTEMELKSGLNGPIQYFRLEQVSLCDKENATGSLQHYISSYSSEWELLQVFDEESTQNRMVYLLYRKQPDQK